MSSPISFLPGSALWVWLAAAAFFLGSVANATGHPKIRDSFVQLGFPAWWCRVTAVFEIAAALLLLLPESRLIGVALGGCVMVVAIGAILARKLYGHLPPPVLFLVLLTLAAA